MSPAYLGGRISLPLGDDLLAAVRKRARKRGMTDAATVRELLTEALRPPPRKLPRPVVGCAVCLTGGVVPVPAAVAVVGGLSVCIGCVDRVPATRITVADAGKRPDPEVVSALHDALIRARNGDLQAPDRDE